MKYYFYKDIVIILNKAQKKYTFVYKDNLFINEIKKAKKINIIALYILGFITRIKKYNLVKKDNL